jgi:ribosomal protein S27AE
MGSLKRCPECHTKFQADEKDIQVCTVCGYWTKKGTARIESIMIYE